MASTELVVAEKRRNWRTQVPEAHRHSLDTRLLWLWNQRFGVLQSIFRDSPDTLDRTAATMLMQAILGKDLDSMELVFKRLEGAPLVDEEVLEQQLKIRV